MGQVKLKVTSKYANLVLDAIAHGAGEGFKIAMNVIAMLIGFIAVIALLDFLLLKTGHLFQSLPLIYGSLNWIFGKVFFPFAWSMGIPPEDIRNAATLFGEKLTINEFGWRLQKILCWHFWAVPIVSQKASW